jgi:transposase
MAANNRKPRRPDDLESLGIVALLEQGLTQRVIALKLGRHHTTVNKWCRAHHLSRGKTGPFR